MKIEEAIKQGKEFADSYERTAVNIIFTANWLRDIQNALLKEHDLLIQHYNVLRIINGRSPGAISPGEIKEVVLDKANDLTRLLDKLVNKGLVNRSLCEENRRRMDITITPKGKKLLERLNVQMGDIKATMKANITDKEADQLNRLLNKLRG